MRQVLRALPLLLIAAGLFAIASNATADTPRADTPRKFWVTKRINSARVAPGETGFVAAHCPERAPVRVGGGFEGHDLDILASTPYGPEDKYGYLAGQWRVVVYNPTDTRQTFWAYVVCAPH